MAKSLPSPNDGVISLTDEGIAEYIEFPSDTIFMESVAHHRSFKSGVAFVPVQRTTGPDKQPESHVYEIQPGVSTATYLFGPLATPDGSTAITIFGSALTSNGILYLCCFNRNSMLVYDLKQVLSKEHTEGTPIKCMMEIEGLASPNDVCIDPKNESVLYIAGGSFRRAFLCCCYGFTNSAYGQVYRVKVDLEKKKSDTLSIKDGFDVLAGIEVVNNEVWVAELYRMFSMPQTGKLTVKPQWEGNDGKGLVWLADNVDVFDDDMILCPAYSAASEFSVKNIVKRNALMSAVLLYYQLSTAWTRGESIQDALQDPEVSLAFSNTYIQEGVDPAPIRLLIMSSDATRVFHYEIDLLQTRQQHEPYEVKDINTGKVLGKRHFFNEQVTHTSQLKTDGGEGYLVFVNFEQPRILLMKDKPFRSAMT